MLVLGVDPGASGGLALVRDCGTEGYEIVAATKMPTTQVRGKVSFDPVAADKWLGDLPAIGLGIIEFVSAMPKQGVASSFQFGRMFGGAEAWLSLTCNSIRYAPAGPWKRKLGLSSDKKASLALATRLFGSNEYWPRVSDEGVAEAALLAVCQLKHNIGS